MDYKYLPDYMKPEELELMFHDILIDNSESSNQNQVLEDICELSERYWHTYCIMNADLKNAISKYIIKRIDYNSFDNIDIILSIIPLLGLKQVLDEILLHKNEIYNNKIINIVEEAYKEYGKTVDDPYFGMKMI